MEDLDRLLDFAAIVVLVLAAELILIYLLDSVGRPED